MNTMMFNPSNFFSKSQSCYYASSKKSKFSLLGSTSVHPWAEWPGSEKAERSQRSKATNFSAKRKCPGNAGLASWLMIKLLVALGRSKVSCSSAFSASIGGRRLHVQPRPSPSPWISGLRGCIPMAVKDFVWFFQDPEKHQQFQLSMGVKYFPRPFFWYQTIMQICLWRLLGKRIKLPWNWNPLKINYATQN